MKTFVMPGTTMTVPTIVLGLMRIEDKTDQHIRELAATAQEVGVTMVDHADIYGSARHRCEERWAEAMQLTPSQREQWIIQSKCGIREGYFDFSYEHIIESVNGSLRALQTDYLDILLLHRPDALVEPDEVARAFSELEAAGKVRAFGVSNHTPGQIELLRRSVSQPLVANQLQLSIPHAPLIAQGVVANMVDEPGSVSRDNGLLDYCRLHDITVQAWSPFQRGFFQGMFLGNPECAELDAVIDRLAAQYEVPPMAIATAWITRHPARMQVVIGTTTPERVRACAAGSELPLTRPEWYELFRAAGHTLP